MYKLFRSVKGLAKGVESEGALKNKLREAVIRSSGLLGEGGYLTPV